MSSKGRTRRLKNGLTQKENAFKNTVLKQIADGKPVNGTQAALEVFDTTDPKVAGQIAHDKLKKVEISEQIDAALEEHGISPSSILQNIGKLASTEPVKVTGETVLKSNIELAKLLNLYPSKKSTSTTYSFKGKIGSTNFKEAKEIYDAIDAEIVELVEESDAPLS